MKHSAIGIQYEELKLFMIPRCVLELWGCHCRVSDPWRHTNSQISATR